VCLIQLFRSISSQRIDHVRKLASRSAIFQMCCVWSFDGIWIHKSTLTYTRAERAINYVEKSSGLTQARIILFHRGNYVYGGEREVAAKSETRLFSVYGMQLVRFKSFYRRPYSRFLFFGIKEIISKTVRSTRRIVLAVSNLLIAPIFPNFCNFEPEGDRQNSQNHVDTSLEVLAISSRAFLAHLPRFKITNVQYLWGCYYKLRKVSILLFSLSDSIRI